MAKKQLESTDLDEVDIEKNDRIVTKLPTGWVHGQVWKLEKGQTVTKQPDGLFTEHENSGKYTYVQFNRTKVDRSVKMPQSAIDTYNKQFMNTLEWIEIL